MKVAVLLFGHLRTFEYCAPYLKKNFLDKYDCDVFIHTWNTMDSETKSWDNKKSQHCPVTEAIKAKIKKIYNPRKILIEEQVIKEEILVHSLVDDKSASLAGIHFMFESMNKANLLRKEYEKEKGISYDIVLVTRPDVAFFRVLELEKTLNEAQILNLNIDKCRFFAGLYGSSETNVRLLLSRVSDILFFAKPHVIDTYIASNLDISKGYANNHFLNVVSIYASNEIKAGILPIEICFACEKDWKNLKEIPVSVVKKHSKLYKFFHCYWLRGKK